MHFNLSSKYILLVFWKWSTSYNYHIADALQTEQIVFNNLSLSRARCSSSLVEGTDTTTRCKSSFSLFCTTSISSDDDTNTNILNAKLYILQDVVKQMDISQKQLKKKAESTKRDYGSLQKKIAMQNEKIRDYETKIDQMEEGYVNSIDRIQKNIGKECKELERENTVLSNKLTSALAESKHNKDTIGLLEEEISKQIEQRKNEQNEFIRLKNQILI